MPDQPENTRRSQPENAEYRSMIQALLNETKQIADVGVKAGAGAYVATKVKQHMSKPKDDQSKEK